MRPPPPPPPKSSASCADAVGAGTTAPGQGSREPAGRLRWEGVGRADVRATAAAAAEPEARATGRVGAAAAAAAVLAGCVQSGHAGRAAVTTLAAPTGAPGSGPANRSGRRDSTTAASTTL